jgi:hypothetical protein
VPAASAVCVKFTQPATGPSVQGNQKNDDFRCPFDGALSPESRNANEPPHRGRRQKPRTQFRERGLARNYATPRNPKEIPVLRLLSVAALASAAFIAAIPNSPVSAAAVTINNIGTSARVPVVTGGPRLAPSSSVIKVQAPHQTPKQRRWVCGPIVNYDGSPHCHWVP